MCVVEADWIELKPNWFSLAGPHVSEKCVGPPLAELVRTDSACPPPAAPCCRERRPLLRLRASVHTEQAECCGGAAGLAIFVNTGAILGPSAV